MGKPETNGLSSETILARLRRHLTEQRPVRLYNTYQGVPITKEAEVAMVHDDFVGLIVHPYQAVCIKNERRTFLESSLIEDLVRAYPVSIDYTNHVVILKQLKIPKNIYLDLHNPWVAPHKRIDVEIQSESDDNLTGTLIEIAVLKENRVRVLVEVPEDVPFSRHHKLTLAFQLDSRGSKVTVKGKARSLAKIRNQQNKKLDLEGQASMEDEITILAYIARREDQIMAALDKAYQKLRKVNKPRRQ